jgi:hypothetical protein
LECVQCIAFENSKLNSNSLEIGKDLIVFVKTSRKMAPKAKRVISASRNPVVRAPKAPNGLKRRGKNTIKAEFCANIIGRSALEFG